MGLYPKGQFFWYVVKETSVSSPERGSKNLQGSNIVRNP